MRESLALGQARHEIVLYFNLPLRHPQLESRYHPVAASARATPVGFAVNDVQFTL
jgi:hypothetical protein